MFSGDKPLGVIVYEWAFRVLNDRYAEEPGEPINRVMGRLDNTDVVMGKGLDSGVGAQQDSRVWLGGGGSKNLAEFGSDLTNREIRTLPNNSNIVKTNYRLCGLYGQ